MTDEAKKDKGKKTDKQDLPPVVAPEAKTDAPEGRLIKYMGTADVMTLARGEDAMGTMPELPYPLRWKKSNNWMINTKGFPEVPNEWWDFMADSGQFADVTGLTVKPPNEHQRAFLGMGGNAVYAQADALEKASDSTSPTTEPTTA